MVRWRIGFTLVELLIALAMISLVLTLAYGSFSTTSKTVEHRENQARALHRASFILHHVSDELQGVYLDPTLYERLGPDGTYFAGAGSEFTFWTQTPAPTRRIGARGGLTLVHYRVLPASMADAPASEAAAALEDEGQVLVCEMFDELSAVAVAEDGFEPEPTARWTLPVESVEFTFYDGDTWSGDWPLSDRKRLPRAVRVAVAVPTGEGATLDLQTVVPIQVTRTTLAEVPEETFAQGAAEEVSDAGDAELFDPAAGQLMTGESGEPIEDAQ